MLKKMEQSTIHRNLTNHYYNETCEVLTMTIVLLDMIPCNLPMFWRNELPLSSR
jgi:hypothetical protein